MNFYMGFGPFLMSLLKGVLLRVVPKSWGAVFAAKDASKNSKNSNKFDSVCFISFLGDF